MSQVPGPKCHAACTHWRTGISAKAKELGWCVHKLEEVELDKLADMSLEEIRRMFANVGNTQWDENLHKYVIPGCAVCEHVVYDS